MCICLCVQVCVCVCRPEASFRCLSLAATHLGWLQDKFSALTNWIAMQTQRCPTPATQHWECKNMPPYLAFKMKILGIEFRSPCLGGKNFVDWTASLAPLPPFLVSTKSTHQSPCFVSLCTVFVCLYFFHPRTESVHSGQRFWPVDLDSWHVARNWCYKI